MYIMREFMKAVDVGAMSWPLAAAPGIAVDRIKWIVIVIFILQQHENIYKHN